MKKVENYLSFATFRIREGMTLKQFCEEHGTYEKFCVAESEQLKRGDVVVVKNINKKLHVVLPLETLEKIATKYNVSVQHIKTLNNINQIFIGQQIFI